MAAPEPVAEPFPIFSLAHKYLLYDPETIAHVRAKHNMGGVLIGGLPQAPQQNVFLGVPVELMLEEARLLVEKDVAFIVDDVQAHKDGFMNGGGAGLSPEERQAYQASLRKQGQAAALQVTKRTDDRRKAALSKLAAGSDWNDIPEDMFAPTSRSASRQTKRKPRSTHPSGSVTPATNGGDDESLLPAPVAQRPPGGPPPAGPPPGGLPPPGGPPPSDLSRTNSAAAPEPFHVTPTTSYPPLAAGSRPPPPPRSSSASTPAPPASTGPPSSAATPLRSVSPPATPLPLPEVPSSYPMFAHLHSKDYFMSPGLRFGCQYTVYPGDPLRFHSHFLCNGMGWDDEFPLLDIIGGGRLGTGVKKGFLIGGEEKKGNESTGKVRTFGIEWGGM